jgi:hypothetical protein
LAICFRATTNRIVTLSPQPASDVVTVQYHLAHSSPVVISIVDMLGAERLSAAQGLLQAAGERRVELPLQNLPNGMYRVIVRSAAHTQALPLVITR